MTDADLNYVHAEDTWLCTIRQTHYLFCDCDHWLQHLIRLLDLQHPGWHDQPTGEGTGGDPDTGVPDDGPTDAELVAAAEDAELGDAVENNLRLDFYLRFNPDSNENAQ